jgi:hypothetical protein
MIVSGALGRSILDTLLGIRLGITHES